MTRRRKALARLMIVIFLCLNIVEISNAEITYSSISGNFCRNLSVDIVYAGENWHFYDSEELNVLNAIRMDELPSDLNEIVQQNSGMVIMFGESPDRLKSIAVSISYYPGAGVIIDRQTMEAVVRSIYDQLDETWEKMGRKIVQSSVISDELIFSEDHYYGYELSYEESGTAVFLRQLMYAYGDYIVCLTSTASSLDEAGQVMHGFYRQSDFVRFAQGN